MTDPRSIDFYSHGTRCGALLFLPAGEGPHPCVVMAPGFGAVREARLDAFAERFAAAGIAALDFDYRHFGASDGLPRHLLDIDKQRDDWHSAIDFVKTLPMIDSARVAAWGTSFSGGHVIEVAATRDDLSAVIAQVPFVDGRAVARANGPRQSARLGAAAFRDLLSSAAGRGPHYVPIVGPPGSLGAMTTPGAEAGYFSTMPPELIERVGWKNAVAARVFLKASFNRPVASASKVTCPLLMVVGDNDEVTPPAAAIKAANSAPNGTLKRFPVSHFDVYEGKWFESVVGEEIEFLTTHLVNAGKSRSAAKA